MTGNEPTLSGLSQEVHGMRANFVVVVLIQFVLLAGLLILYLQIAGIPDQTSQLIPDDGTATQVLFELDPIGTNITDLQTQVAAMAAKLDAICTMVEKSNPAAASPNACAAP